MILHEIRHFHYHLVSTQQGTSHVGDRRKNLVETLLTVLFAAGFIGGFYFLAHYFGINLSSPDDPEPRQSLKRDRRRDEYS